MDFSASFIWMNIAKGLQNCSHYVLDSGKIPALSWWHLQDPHFNSHPNKARRSRQKKSYKCKVNAQIYFGSS